MITNDQHNSIESASSDYGVSAAMQHDEARDPLTGILTKDSFFEQARALIDEHPDTTYAFITSDIEHFRAINDQYGHEMGDVLLKFSAESVQKSCDVVGGLCGRYFADIFLSVVPMSEGLLDIIVERTLKGSEQGPVLPPPNIKFGVYMIEDRNLSLPAMCDRSLMALSTIRGCSRVSYAIYEERFRETMLKERFVIENIQSAIENGEIHVHLQPKIDLKEYVVSGAEALVRWMSPVNGFISPADFIPILEAKGNIFSLDYHVWEIVCQTIRRWTDDGDPIVPISVNVSQADIDNPSFEEMLVALIEKYRVPIDCFVLEITETVCANLPERVVDVIHNLRERGFRVEMDDFGSGYSSLSKLKDFPIDDLKIDLGFLSGEDERGRGDKILRLVVDLANDLELSVIAEGVEKQEQAGFLANIGCQTAQGYYFAKPMPIADFETMLAKERAARASEEQ